ncbi:hypothetical protein C8J36_113128 [Rhizobium sp. PP-F2F-G48]|nr:hypothetical protein C8J36_113128 [Rhizobium sp. PP-F2F-G48]
MAQERGPGTEAASRLWGERGNVAGLDKSGVPDDFTENA